MAMEIALTVHLVGVAILFVAIGITEVGGTRLRRSKTVEEIGTWSPILELAGRMFAPAFLVILGAGIYMAQDTWGFDRPFIVIGIATVVVMIVLGGAYVGRSFAAIGRAFADGDATTADIPRLVVRRPALWAVNAALDGIAIGMIWVMVSKPSYPEGIGVVVGLALVAALLGSLAPRRGANAGN